MIRVTRQYRFSASHRLHSPALSEEENWAKYGKCNNPYGHGHNYTLQVTAAGPVDPESGLAVNPAALDNLVENRVLNDVRTANLNDLPDFANRVPTTENLAEAIRERLSGRWKETFGAGGPSLEKVRILETRRNFFETSG